MIISLINKFYHKHDHTLLIKRKLTQLQNLNKQ